MVYTDCRRGTTQSAELQESSLTFPVKHQRIKIQEEVCNGGTIADKTSRSHGQPY